jgi:hypothetical protein
MKRWTEEPGAPWLAEVRKLQRALRELEGPFPDLPGLLSPGDEVLGLLADSPEDLPLVAFAPFAVLPGNPTPAPAGRTEETVERARRAPEPPRPTAGRPQTPRPVVPAASPVPRASGVVAEAVRERPRESAEAAPKAAPVFSLRSRGSTAAAVPRTEPRASAQSPHFLAPPPEGRGRNAAEKSSGGGVPLPVTGDMGRPRPQAGEVRAQEEAGEVRAQPEAGEVGGALKLLGRLADDVLRERDAPPGAGLPALPVLRLRETVPPGKRETERAAPIPSPDRSKRLREIPAPVPAAARDVEPVDLGALARRGAPALPGVDVEAPVAATLGEPPIAAPQRPAEVPAAAPSFEGPFGAETLADLVNEALIEQARRHGVDLS